MTQTLQVLSLVLSEEKQRGIQSVLEDVTSLLWLVTVKRMGCFIESLALLRRSTFSVCHTALVSGSHCLPPLTTPAALLGPSEMDYPCVAVRDLIFFKTVSVIPYVCGRSIHFYQTGRDTGMEQPELVCVLFSDFNLGTACTAVFNRSSNGQKEKNVACLRVISIFLIWLGI